MLVLRASDHRVMPWKNGGGETTEVALSPAGAALDGFDWRVSMARVAQDGPFSAFPGIDRTLSILQGEGLDLVIGEAPPLRLTRDSAPLTFAADTPTTAGLVGSPILDLNVMSRRGRVVHHVEPLHVEAGARVKVASGATLLLVTEGSVTIEDGVVRQGLSALDAVTDLPDRAIAIESRNGPAKVFRITFASA